MSLSNLFEKIAGRQRQREQTRTNDFRSPVLAIAGGDEPDPDHIDRVLAAAGKTLDELKSAAELHQRRVEMRKKLDAMPKLEAEQGDIRKQIEKADAVLAEAKNQHAASVAPLYRRLEELQAEVLDADRCREELVGTCTDAALLAEMAELTEKLRLARERRSAANIALSLQSSYRVGGGQVGVFDGPREQVENLRRAHASGAWEREPVEAEKLIAALEKEEAALHERMRTP